MNAAKILADAIERSAAFGGDAQSVTIGYTAEEVLDLMDALNTSGPVSDWVLGPLALSGVTRDGRQFVVEVTIA